MMRNQVPFRAGIFAPPDITFFSHYDSGLCKFMSALAQRGIPGLLNIDQQTEQPSNQETQFYNSYNPTEVVDPSYPIEGVDFTPSGAYSPYNWELFFHAPILIATRLSQNRRFEEAQKWFHYVFNPTAQSPPNMINTVIIPQDSSSNPPGNTFSPNSIVITKGTTVTWQNTDSVGHTITSGLASDAQTGTIFDSGLIAPGTNFAFSFDNAGTYNYFDEVHPWLTGQVIVVEPGIRYWNVRPFKTTEIDKLEELFREMSFEEANNNILPNISNFITQIQQWKLTPFNPFVVARLRPVAFMKYTVMAYLDNLIAWGDQLFRQNTRETINQATQLYILAAHILGDAPKQIQTNDIGTPQTYNSLKQKYLDSFSNSLVDMENQFPLSNIPTTPTLGETGTSSLGPSSVLYFCIPQNEQLLQYWGTVEDRLQKIRNCMNIEGQVEQLALFEPPANPALLVSAAAAGMDLGSILSDINAAIPYYRFSYMMQKTLELCGELKSLGSQLLSALEKNDAEALTLLRSSTEISLLTAVLEVKKLQSQEAQKTLDGLTKSQQVVQIKYNYYSNMPQRIDEENTQLSELKIANDFQGAAQIVQAIASASSLIPDFDAGASGAMGTPVVKFRWGGTNLANALRAASEILSFIASIHTYQANKASILGGWHRRSDEWKFQSDSAKAELDQIQSQMDAATLRKTIADDEITNQQLQIDNAKSVDQFMRSKFTNQDLYSWMVSQVSSVYFQTYQMVYDMAKQAERTYCFELGLKSSSFIQFGYWDSLKQGLLAGEQLYFALKQMEKSYIAQNKREYEISKKISLALLDPIALISLKETGRCHVSLPEEFFDMDYPGHYMRRIKNVSLTTPCVVGPYTSVNCTLTLLSNRIRANSDLLNGNNYAEMANKDPRFIYNFSTVQSIATSHGQNDSGMFEVNFHDERYLPFEGCGTISNWVIEMPKECNAFDFETISDIIINLNYTSREGGENMRDSALTAAILPQSTKQDVTMGPRRTISDQKNLYRLISAKHEFSSAWYQFMNPNDGDVKQTLHLDLTQERFPFRYRGKTIKISEVEMFLKFKDDSDNDNYSKLTQPLNLSIQSPDNDYPSDPTKPINLDTKSSPMYSVPYSRVDGMDDDIGTWIISASVDDIKNIVNANKNKNKKYINDFYTQLPSGTSNNYYINKNTVDDLIIVLHYSVTK